jgi:flagella basal body P-ring formation protein FlgA
VIRRLAPALIFMFLVSAAIAALAASHALGASAGAGLVASPGGATAERPADPPRLGTEAVAALARDWLAGRVARDVERGAIELLAAPRELVLPAGEVVTSVSLQSGSLAGGPVTVLVEAVSEDRMGVRTTRSATATFRINARHDVVVVTRDVGPRTILAAADVRIERRPFDRMPPGALREVREAIGKEATRGVAQGEPLTTSAVAAPRAVRRGAVVTLLVEGQGFRVAARGVASEDGAVGDTIRVVNQTSHREMAGRVEDDRTVRIPF